MASSVTSKPRFSTILSWRGSADNRPSDLEFELRSHCQKLIVKATPLSGAHLLMTSEHIAVRAYYPCDLQDLKEQEKKISASNFSDNNDFDGLSGFFSSFQLALVFFILPPMSNYSNQIAEELDDTGSYFHRAQRLSIQYQEETLLSSHYEKNAKNDGTNSRKSLVMILPDTQSAIQNLIAIADSFSKERKVSKKVFIQRLETKFFLPSSSNREPDAKETVDPVAVSQHVRGGIRELARIFELPLGEVEILMSELGDLKTIATADESMLENIPIDKRTRKFLHSFFGSSKGHTETVPMMKETPIPSLLIQQEGFHSFSRSSMVKSTPASSSSMRHHADFPQKVDIHNLPSVTPQLFSHSNTSRLSLSPSNHHRAQHNLSPQSGLTEEHDFNAFTADEPWLEPVDVEATIRFPSIDDGNDEILYADNAFLVQKDAMTNLSGPANRLALGRVGSGGMEGQNQESGNHRSNFQFSPVHPAAPPSQGSDSPIHSFRISRDQTYRERSQSHPYRTPQRYKNVSQQRSQVQYHMEQSGFSNRFAHSRPRMFQSERIDPANSHHYGLPRMRISSSRNRDDHQRYHHEKQFFNHTEGYQK